MKVHNNIFSRSSHGLELIFNSMETNISIADGLNTHQLISNFMETKRMFALVIGVIMAILSPLIVAGNALIILVVWKDPLRNIRSFTSTYILLSMAVADFLVGAILCPLNSDWSLLIRAGDKPSFSIRVPLTINAVLTSVSIGHVLLLTIDRLFALLTPLQYRVRVTNRLVSITALTIWAYALALGVLHATLTEHFIIFCIIYTAQVLVSATVIISINVVIMRHFQSHSTRDAAARGSLSIHHPLHRDRQLFKSIALIVCIFLLCFTPWFIIQSIMYFFVLYQLRPDSAILKGLWVSSVFVYINSGLNPFLYSWRLARFRDSLKCLLTNRKDQGIQQEHIELEQFDTRL